MAKTISKLEAVGSFFNGRGDIIVASPLTLATASLADITNPLSLGDIKEGSTKWTGEAPKFNEVKNEQGEAIITVPVNGTYGVEFTVLSFSAEMQDKLLGANSISTTFATGDFAAVGATVSGFGVDMPVLECPVILANTDLNQMIVFPNAKIVSQMIDDNGVTCIKCTVTAQKVDTAKLQTVMHVKGAAQYTA